MYEEKIRNQFRFYGGVSFVYGIVFAFCMYRNLFGATFLLYAVSTVAVLWMFSEKIGENIRKETKIYFAAIILCGLSTCITANKWIQFMNWCCIIVLLLLSSVSQFFENREWNLFSYFVYLSNLFFKTIKYSLLPLKEAGIVFEKEKKKEHRHLPLILTGAVAAAVVLMIIFPLLINSDLVFKRIFGSVLSIFDFSRILPNIRTGAGIAVTILVGFVLIYGFFYASCKADFSSHPERKMAYGHALTGITFTSVIALVYLLYSAVQIVFLFLRTGLPEGISYSEYAHSGFWQLAAVAVINVIMVMLCTYLFRENKWLQGILTVISLCTYVMMISAAYRMYLYVQAYHLTVLRLLVLWFLAVLALIMGGVIVSIYRKEFKLPLYMIGVMVSGYLLLSFAQPDYWIARYNVDHMEQITRSDLNYMMYGLSLDAAPVIAEIYASAENISDESDIEIMYYDVSVSTQFDHYFQDIAENSQDIDFRKANFSRLRAKKVTERFLQ